MNAAPATKTADVLIVGGGPAGSSVAYQLAKRGIDVLVIEKQQMPRYKTCGGGVNVRAARLLPFDLAPVIERTIYRYRFTYRGERPFTRESPEPLTYMTQRMNLDNYLLDQARAAGARVDENVTIRKIDMAGDHASATADNGDVYHAKVVVGADGANSVVARDLSLADGVQREIALESEIALPPDEIAAWNDTIEIDLFSVWCGYGWVFPKEKHISIGVGGPKAEVRHIQEYNKRYLAHHQVADLKPLRFSGHGLPIRASHLPVVSGRGLLVGDAAGLLEPFTGEGIGNAVKSGQIAAETITAYLQGKTDSLETYNARLNAEVMPDLWDAQQFVRAFNRFPKLFYRLIRDNDYVWRSICKILRGERGFSDINRKLGVLKYVIRWL